MKQFFISILLSFVPMFMSAQGWPAEYQGVMLQGFYWDSFNDTKWKNLESQADELAEFFSLVWIPQSGKCQSTSMGYDPYYYWNQNSSFGSEAELRSLIGTFKRKGIGTIADVVVNHHQTNGWFGFPAETYKGVTYQFQSTDICANDDGGKAKTEAAKQGVSLSANNDEGEGWDGMRDLDHKSANVQKIVKAYVDYLANDLGYSGFRYDMVRGFKGVRVGEYNKHAGVQYSVGECWDSNEVIKNWIASTKVDDNIQSAAFDFQFRYNVRDAINNGDWSLLKSTNNLVSSKDYRRYSITFVENHDVEKRATDPQDPIWRDTIAANAYMLAMPGTPCVFLKHWMYCKREIKKMIAARQLMGVHNMSTYYNMAAQKSYFTNCVQGKNGNLVVVVGSNPAAYENSAYKELCSGKGYRYLVPTDFDISKWKSIVDHINATTIDVEEPRPEFKKPECVTVQSGTYAYFELPADWTSGSVYAYAWNNTTGQNCGAWPGSSTVQVGKSFSGNKIYRWTYSGSVTPENIIFSTQTKSGSQFTTLKQTMNMVFSNGGYYTNNDGLIGHATDPVYVFTVPSCATVQQGTYAYFEKPSSWSSSINVWAWNSDNLYPGAQWPGTVSQKDISVVGSNPDTGLSVYLWKYSGTVSSPSYIIFNDGSRQTSDFVFENGGYYTIDGKMGVATDIADVIVDESPASGQWHTLNGMRIDCPTSKGIYIYNGKKFVVK